MNPCPLFRNLYAILLLSRGGEEKMETQKGKTKKERSAHKKTAMTTTVHEHTHNSARLRTTSPSSWCVHTYIFDPSSSPSCIRVRSHCTRSSLSLSLSLFALPFSFPFPSPPSSFLSSLLHDFFHVIARCCCILVILVFVFVFVAILIIVVPSPHCCCCCCDCHDDR